MKDIRGYEGRYAITQDGAVYSYLTSRFLKHFYDQRGYYSVCLFKEGKSKRKRVHRLVAEAFIINKENYDFINHKDGIKTNNLVSNLEWCSASMNVKHAYEAGLYENQREAARKMGKKYGSQYVHLAVEKTRKLSEKQVREIVARYKKGETGVALAKEFNVSSAAISLIVNRKTYKNAT